MSVCGSLGMIMLHPKYDKTMIAMHIWWEDTLGLPERVRIRDINDILDILPSH